MHTVKVMGVVKTAGFGKGKRTVLTRVAMLMMMWACTMAAPPASCADHPVVAGRAQDGAGLRERLLGLRKERRARMQAYALLSEVALFDEGAIQGRTVQPVPNNVADNEVFRGQQVAVGREHSGIGFCGVSMASGGDVETIAREIQRLERQIERRRSVAP